MGLLGRFKQMAKGAVKTLMVGGYRVMLPILPVQKNMVIFDSSIGLNYTGNPRAVYERMGERGLDQKFRCIWLFQKGKAPEHLPGTAKVVCYGRFLHLYYMSVAAVWIFDTRQPKFIRKKKNQLYIQTWHGTPLKKLALDMDSVHMSSSHDILQYHREFTDNTKTWDYLIAQNVFSAEIFPRCFDFHKKMLCIGYPRNDVLFAKNNPREIKRLRQELGLPAGTKKVLLYAPTWRDDEYDPDGVYQFHPALDFTKLKEALCEEYVIAVKYHYLVGDRIDWSGMEGFVYPFNAQAEISSLYLVADALITDYSSVMFDYSLLHRALYFYTYDLEKYRDELRGFYFDFLEEAPGPISLTTEELIGDIKRYGTKIGGEFIKKAEAFYKTFHTYEKGTASDQVIEEIESWRNTKGKKKDR